MAVKSESVSLFWETAAEVTKRQVGPGPEISLPQSSQLVLSLGMEVHVMQPVFSGCRATCALPSSMECEVPLLG